MNNSPIVSKVLYPIQDKKVQKLMIYFGIALFLIVNTLKICLFDTLILYSISRNPFIYKFIFTFVLNILLFILIFSCKRRSVFFTFYFLQTIYIIFLLSYTFFTHGYFHISAIFGSFSEGLKAANEISIKGLITPNIFIAFIDFPLFAFLAVSYKKISNIRNRNKRPLIIIFLISFIMVIGLQVRTYSHELFLTQIIKSPSAGEALVVERYGTFVNSLLDSFIKKDGKYLAGQLKYGPELTCTNTKSSIKPNFIIIQVESMNASIVDEKHDGKYVTPFLHTLTNNSVFYPYALSYHEGGGTSDCEFSVINSVEPLSDYPAIKVRNYNYPNSFVKQLDSAGYDVQAFHANEANYFNRRTAFTSMGFNTFNDINSMNLKQIVWGAPDGELFNYVSNKVKAQNGPFLDYCITISSHTPFSFVRNYNYNNSLFSDIKNSEIQNYFNSMAYVDNSINKFVTYIRNNYKDTYILIWGDHTPPLESKDTYFPSSFTSENEYFEFVPLFILTPDNKVYKETKTVASFLDIAPTILEASGVPFTLKTQGENLLNTPITDKKLPFKKGSYSRKDLFQKINKKKPLT